VSWFAANAYCEQRGGRLPTWTEWEYVAAADEVSRDARSNAAWRQRMLNWYSRPNAAVLQRVGASPANVFGVQDLHGLVWEWVADFNSLLVSADSRGEGDPDITRFCGSGAISMEQKENYAILMRVAMLSSLQARYTTENLGFRCAYDRGKVAP
jgi:formylglycine-generating enzyme required for sulfatase activity